MNAAMNLFLEPWVQRLGWVLIHFLWQGMGVALLLALALRIFAPASSHTRYVVMGSALLICGVMPVITWTILGAPTRSSVPLVAIHHSAQDRKIDAFAPTPHFAPDMVLRLPGDVHSEWRPMLHRLAEVVLPYTVCLWFGGVFLLTVRLTLGWTLLWRLCGSGFPIRDSFCMDRFQELLRRMRVDVPVQLLESTLVEVPTLIGWLRPTLLVPASVFTGLTPDQLEAILAHELAHVRRYDYLVNLFQTVIETILFYHPAVWWISRKLREERENCCDDMALEVVQDRLVYAGALARLEEKRAMPLALAASDGSLLQRIKRIAGANDRKVSAWPLWMLIFGLLSMAWLAPGKATEAPNDARQQVQSYLEITSIETTDTSAKAGSGTIPKEMAEALLQDHKNKITKLIDSPLGLGTNTVKFQAPSGLNGTVTVDWKDLHAANAQSLTVKMETSNWSMEFKPSPLRADECFLITGGNAKTPTTSHILIGFVDHPAPPQKDAENPVPKTPLKGSIEIGLKVIEIRDDVYLANKEKIDAAVEKADIDLFHHLKGSSLLSLPSVTTPPGVLADIEIVRVFPYPTSFASGRLATNSADPSGKPTVGIPPTPREFATKDVGVSAEITPSIDDGNSPTHGKIILNGKLSVTTFEGFTESNFVGAHMPSFSTSESLFIEALNDHELKGVWVPGEHVAEEGPPTQSPGKMKVSPPMIKKRFLLFVSANLVK